MDRRARAIASIVGTFATGAAALVGAAGPARAQATTRVSVDSAGVESDGASAAPAVSADGRFVAFTSSATNLVAGDVNGCDDIFVHDGLTGATELVSVDSTFLQANKWSSDPSLSDDGRFVVFRSAATNLVAGDTNRYSDVFVRDRQNGTTELVSVDSKGAQADGVSFDPAISGDGRLVVFHTKADNLVLGDTNGCSDVFVRDLAAGTTARASIDSAGGQANGESYAAAVSADSRIVAFRSAASDLVLGDTNQVWDVFVHDLQSGVTERVSVDSSGLQADDESHHPSLSADGSVVAFYSYATNLVAGDTNGALDVFVRDRAAGTTERVSVDAAGGEGDGDSRHPSISADSRFVAFESAATNLFPGDANGTWDALVHDRQTGATRLASIGSNGIQGDGQSLAPSLSADARQVAFISDSTNLVPSNLNGVVDVFVSGRDLTLEVDPPFATTGSRVRFTTWTGQNAGPCMLVVTEVNGTPLFLPAAFAVFDAQGRWVLPVSVPPGLNGMLFTFETWGVVPSGRVDLSNPFLVGFQ